MKNTSPAPTVAHVYIVENELGLVKIGFAHHPEKRIKALENSSGLAVTRRYVSQSTLAASDLEGRLHVRFTDRRKHGEWFDMPFDDAVAALDKMQAQEPPQQALTPFDFQGLQVRTVMEDGEPWFVARDVCDCLGLTDTGKSLARLRDNEKLTRKIFGSGQEREMYLVNEPGLYRLIFTSNKAEAQIFQDWVYHEVLPAIRKTGAYTVDGFLAPELRQLVQAEVARAFSDTMQMQHSVPVLKTTDEWEGLIEAWINENNLYRVGNHEVLSECLGISSGQFRRQDEMRVAAILKRFGWRKIRGRAKDGSRKTVYVRKDSKGLEDIYARHHRQMEKLRRIERALDEKFGGAQ